MQNLQNGQPFPLESVNLRTAGSWPVSRMWRGFMPVQDGQRVAGSSIFVDLF
jgi:hypothetical protein